MTIGGIWPTDAFTTPDMSVRGGFNPFYKADFAGCVNPGYPDGPLEREAIAMCPIRSKNGLKKEN